MNEQYYAKLCFPISKPLDPAFRAILPEIVHDFVEQAIHDKELCMLVHEIYNKGVLYENR